MTSYTLFVTCPRGLESVLATELQQCGASRLQAVDGGCYASGTLETVYRINLHARSAGRVLIQLAQGGYRNEQDVYALARSLRWDQWFGLSQRFRVQAEGRRTRLKSLEFTALKIKDAVCDAFRERLQARPSVDKAHPDVRIHAFFDEQQARIFIDTSGEALFKRGYRQDSGSAPLRENLAAGLLLLAGYDGSQPFQDPFCGSGTLPIEAAMIATRQAPGLRRTFGFEKLANFNAPLWQSLRQQAQAEQRPAPAPIAGSDNDTALLAIARDNALAAGVAPLIDFSCADVCDSRPNGNGGILLSNPPYGVRLAEIQALHALYPQLGSWLKQHYAGWRIGMFTADRELPKLMRLSPKRKIPLYNGNLDCRLFLLDMVSGSNRTEKTTPVPSE